MHKAPSLFLRSHHHRHCAAAAPLPFPATWKEGIPSGQNTKCEQCAIVKDAARLLHTINQEKYQHTMKGENAQQSGTATLRPQSGIITKRTCIIDHQLFFTKPGGIHCQDKAKRDQGEKLYTKFSESRDVSNHSSSSHNSKAESSTLYTCKSESELLWNTYR